MHHSASKPHLRPKCDESTKFDELTKFDEPIKFGEPTEFDELTKFGEYESLPSQVRRSYFHCLHCPKGAQGCTSLLVTRVADTLHRTHNVFSFPHVGFLYLVLPGATLPAEVCTTYSSVIQHDASLEDERVL